jgi:hypothetical protein
VAQAEVLGCLDAVLDGERRRVGLGQDLDGRGGDLDLARGELRVHGPVGAAPSLSRHAHDALVPKAGRRRVRLRLLHRMDHDLDHALAVPQVDEEDAAVVALVRDPPT